MYVKVSFKNDCKKYIDQVIPAVNGNFHLLAVGMLREIFYIQAELLLKLLM